MNKNQKTTIVVLAVIILAAAFYFGSTSTSLATIVSVNITAYPTYSSPISDVDYVCTSEVTHRNLNGVFGENLGSYKIRTMTTAQHRLRTFVEQEVRNAGAGEVNSFSIRHRITIQNQAWQTLFDSTVEVTDFEDKTIDIFLDDALLQPMEPLSVQIQSHCELKYMWQNQQRTFNKDVSNSINTLAPTTLSPDTSPTPAPYQPNPTYNPSVTPPPAPAPTGSPPSSLYISVDPNPLPMGNMLYGVVVSDVGNYPITVHAKHVGQGTEQTFIARLDGDGRFYHAQTINIAGYWDFWVTAGSVTSNRPRVTVQGALCTVEDVSFSRMMEDYTSNVYLFCHSAGTATLYAQNVGTGVITTVGTTHINSGGYGTMELNVAGWSLGNYNIYFVVNGITSNMEYVVFGR